MERRHFQLEEGYLNIDDKAIYLTRSGNWQQALATGERARRRAPASAGRRVIGIVIILLGESLLLATELNNATSNTSIFIGFLFGGLGIYSLYRSLRHDMASEYHVPYAKVLALEGEPLEGFLVVRFLNGDQVEDRWTLKAPPEALHMVRERHLRSRGYGVA